MITFLICSYAATLFGILYLMFTTIPDVFNNSYGFTSSLSGLAYSGLGIGMIVRLA